MGARSRGIASSEGATADQISLPTKTYPHIQVRSKKGYITEDKG